MNNPLSRRQFLSALALGGTGTRLLASGRSLVGAPTGQTGSPNKEQRDWPMIRATAQHAGLISGEMKPPFRLIWARDIASERLATAVEPIVAAGRLFVPTHAGNLYSLDAACGDPLWRFQTRGALLHSPAVAKSVLVFGSTDGTLYGLSAETGKMLWQVSAGRGGFSASPVIDDGVAYIGTRGGDFLAVSLEGKLLWKAKIGFPIRQTAALSANKVVVAAEDLVARCFERSTGQLLWNSGPFPGQTARDYYLVIVRHNDHTYAIIRTNPLLNIGQRISRDRTLLCHNAQIDDSSWQNLDSWLKSERARGTPELWAREQKAIRQHLLNEPDARTFFVLDVETGKEPFTAPVLWIAGCQGVGAQPALTADGRLLVFYRSAYGNWNRGVAPMVTLGRLDLADGTTTPLFHQQGMEPAWNCFWGTADESQNFLVVGDTVLIVHQGTLSGFNLDSNELFAIWGERDTFGGFQNPPWARNEWHGPARSGVAVCGSRIYWQTGSRILCLASKEQTTNLQKTQPVTLTTAVRSATAPPAKVRSRKDLALELAQGVEVLLSRAWAPLFTDPGLAGRVFSFEHTTDLLEALAWSFPHLGPELQAKTKARVRQEWRQAPPCSQPQASPLDQGERREFFSVGRQYCQRLGGGRQAHPFGSAYATGLVAKRCGETTAFQQFWPAVKASYEQFRATAWRLDPSKGDPFANRYLSSLMTFRSLAERFGERSLAQEATSPMDATTEALLAWWNRAAEHGTLTTFNKSADLDRFINHGDTLFFAVAPHRHQLALFQDLTPEIAALLKAKAPEAVRQVWRTFVSLCPTWHLLGEERQVHFGENFLDPPEFSFSAFKALAWLGQPTFSELITHADVPFCRADLYYLTKLALALELGA